MRISVVSYSRSRIGGAEQNLSVVLPELERRGHQVQFVSFHRETMRPDVETGPGTRFLHAAGLSPRDILAPIREFAPDVINARTDIPNAVLEGLIPIAATAYSVHNYYGTCISGFKANQFPIVEPCRHEFSPACLLRYLPRRCGGLNPVTMVGRYATERERLRILSRFGAIVTHSRAMQEEYERYGLTPVRVVNVPYEAGVPGPALHGGAPPLLDCARLLYVGRVEKLKGVRLLIEALPRIGKGLGRRVELTIAGDGTHRERCLRAAERVRRDDPLIEVHFVGWKTGAQLKELFAASHLLVMPSLWPEPFAKVGPEAHASGLPVVAFALGGVSDWLMPGYNGFAAAADPPSAEGLARSVVQALADPVMHEKLRAGALLSSHRFSVARHVDALVDTFERICRDRELRAAA